MARRELGTRSRLAALGGAVALLLVLGALLDGGEGEEIGLLRAADFIAALDEAGIETFATARTLACRNVTPTSGAVEHYATGRFWLSEWPTVEGRTLSAHFRGNPQGLTRHSCMAESCIEWVFWNANLVLTADTRPECNTTDFEPTADPDLARVVEVFLALEAGR